MTAALVLSICFAVSLGLSLVLVRSRLVRNRLLARRDDLSAAQAIHLTPTPRLGGIPVLVAVAVALLAIPTDHALGWLILAALPVIVAGTMEDTGHLVSPPARLAAASASALAAVGLFGIWVPVSGIAVLDLAFGTPVVAVAITLLWVAGVCHGFNLIDGVNGLAGGLAALIAAGLATVSYRVEEQSLALVQVALIPGILGFLVLNWPSGRIFLGDAGAYGLGFFLAWLAMILAWKVPDVSSVALSLMFFWPVAGTFMAMYRRRSSGRRIDAPDRLHFHQLVYRVLSRLLAGRMRPIAINSFSGVLTLLFSGFPVLAAVLLWNAPHLAMAGWVFFGLLFVLSYRGGVRFLRRRGGGAAQNVARIAASRGAAHKPITPIALKPGRRAG